MSDERDLLEAEAMLKASEPEPEPQRKPAKLVTCEACPETVYEKDIHKIGNLHLCPKCAEKERASQVQARVESVREATTPFPSLNARTQRLPIPPAPGSIANNDLDPDSEEYRAIFNEVIISIVDVPKDEKLFVVRERIDKLDAFIRKARIQRQALTVAIDDLYEGATEEERAKLLEQDKLFKAKNPRKTSGPKVAGELKLTKAEQSYPSNWDTKARKAGTVFLGMGMTVAAVNEKLKEMGLVK